VLASEPECLVGIDVMTRQLETGIDASLFYTDLQSCFTAYEWMIIANDLPNKANQFFLHWALKESYIKALGIGLGFELQRAEFHIEGWDDQQNPHYFARPQEQTSIVLWLDGTPSDLWSFDALLLDAEHVVAVAYGSSILPCSSGTRRTLPVWPSRQIPFTFLTIQELLLELK